MLMKNASTLRWFLLRVLLAFLLATAAPYRCSAAAPQEAATFLDRPQDGTFDLRVMNWNVWRNSIFPGGVRRESFERIISAVRPDVVCLQEIDPKSAGELSGIMDRLLPLQNGLRWQTHFATNLASVVVSRYPLLRRGHEVVIPRPAGRFYLGHVMCLVDLPQSQNAPDVYVIVAHFSAGADDASIRARQVHSFKNVKRAELFSFQFFMLGHWGPCWGIGVHVGALGSMLGHWGRVYVLCN